MQIRLANTDDISAIVAIHIERFSHFFLTTLGEDFLKVYYQALLRVPGILIVLEDQQQIKGFVAGNYSNSSFYKIIIRNNFVSLSKCGVHLLFSKPKSLLRILNNLFNASKYELLCSELLSIATVRNVNGYGSTLLEFFEKIIINNSQAKSNLISLTTDIDNNDKAINFYLNNGYQIDGEFKSYGNRMMYRLVKKI